MVDNPARGSALHALRLHHQAAEEEEKARVRRKKGLLVLILQYLLDQGYRGSHESLERECGVSLKSFTVGDNVDLLSVLMEYEEYFNLRFGRPPKIFRANAGGIGGDEPGTGSAVRGVAAKRRNPSVEERAGQVPVRPPPGGGRGATSSGPGRAKGADAGPSVPSSYGSAALAGPGSPVGLLPLAANARGPLAPESSPTLAVAGAGMAAGRKDEVATGNSGDRPDPLCPYVLAPEYAGGGADAALAARKFLKPLPNFHSTELNELAQLIQHDILDTSPGVRWGDVVEHDEAKQLLKEAVELPLKYPQLFAAAPGKGAPAWQSYIRPWRGILLFGPPGTGKTMLAKAVATECNTTFFNVSASTLVSKWRGESEKLVKLLFDLAYYYAPSTIFIDELDALLSARSSSRGYGGSGAGANGASGGGSGVEHEGSRRMKTQLLIEMDGLNARKGGELVIVLAASNVPWDLEPPVLRRLEKRILVGLPSHEARMRLFQSTFEQAGVVPARKPPANAGDGEKKLGANAEDERHVVDFNRCADLTDGFSGADIDIVCREAIMRQVRRYIGVLESRPQGAVAAREIPHVTTEDVLASIQCTRSSANVIPMARYEKWKSDFGAGMS